MREIERKQAFPQIFQATRFDVSSVHRKNVWASLHSLLAKSSLQQVVFLFVFYNLITRSSWCACVRHQRSSVMFLACVMVLCYGISLCYGVGSWYKNRLYKLVRQKVTVYIVLVFKVKSAALDCCRLLSREKGGLNEAVSQVVKIVLYPWKIL